MAEPLAFLLAHQKELESPTFRLGGGRSIQLSYWCVSCVAIVAKKIISVNEKTALFSPLPAYDREIKAEGCENMEREEQEQSKDIDDLIFGDEEWFPSNR